MRVTKKIIKPEFQPFEISIHVETQKQLDMLLKIAGYDVTVPHALLNADVINQEQQEILSNLLRKLFEVISN